MRSVLPFVAGSLLIAMTLSGCAEVGYYAQSLVGGARVLAQRRSIATLLADPETEPRLRRQLESVIAIRDFASRELGLPENRSYRTYVELDGDAVSWTVTATPELSVRPITWCFPVAGCVSYKGFFKREKARRFADSLRDEGYDVSWGGVSAYSTLGWFADPVLSTFLDRSEIDLAGLVFHELAHQVLYVKNGTDFNESFATAVELAGVRRWLEAGEGQGASQVNSQGASQEASLEAYRRARDREDQLSELLLDYRQRLEVLFATESPAYEKRQGKLATYAELQGDLIALRDRWQDPTALTRWIGRELNNADLVSAGAYRIWVPAFEALLAEAGSLPAFYAQVRKLADLEPTEREQHLRALSKKQ